MTTSQGADERNFTVFAETLPPITLDHVEITQGLATYPCILGKQTLIWASFQGIFGHPTADEAEVIVSQNGRVKKRKSYSHARIELDKNRSFVHFHIDDFDVRRPGTFQFDVRFRRSDQEIASWRSPECEFIDTRNLSILFVKLTDQPEENWANRPADPFGWFDPNGFYQGIRTVSRVFPVNNASYQFAQSRYTSILENGLKDFEVNDLVYTLQRVISDFTDPTGSGWKPTRVVGLFDPRLSNLRAAAISVGNAIVLPFHIRHWGGTLAHELGHTYDLVPHTQPNHHYHDGDHSKNILLDQELGIGGTPPTAWNSLTDILTPAEKTNSLMTLQGGTDQGFFESKAPGGEPLCYHHLVGQLKK